LLYCTPKIFTVLDYNERTPAGFITVSQTVNLNEELTLFVGKNNAGKTSLMNLMDMIVSGSKVGGIDGEIINHTPHEVMRVSAIFNQF